MKRHQKVVIRGPIASLLTQETGGVYRRVMAGARGPQWRTWP